MGRRLGTQPVTDAKQARLDKYAELRDGGMSSWDAATELGLSKEGARRPYERWYRARRGLPPRRQEWRQ